MTFTKLKLKYPGGVVRYCVRNEETGVVGIYTLRHHPRTGEVFSADRDTHTPDPEGEHCEFLGGPGHCDGSGLVPIYINDRDCWKEAEISSC